MGCGQQPTPFSLISRLKPLHLASCVKGNYLLLHWHFLDFLHRIGNLRSDPTFDHFWLPGYLIAHTIVDNRPTETNQDIAYRVRFQIDVSGGEIRGRCAFTCCMEARDFVGNKGVSSCIKRRCTPMLPINSPYKPLPSTVLRTTLAPLQPAGRTSPVSPTKMPCLPLLMWIRFSRIEAEFQDLGVCPVGVIPITVIPTVSFDSVGDTIVLLLISTSPPFAGKPAESPKLVPIDSPNATCGVERWYARLCV